MLPNGYPYWYVGSYSGSLAQNATTTITVRFAEGTWFELQSLRAFCSLDTSSITFPLGFSAKLSDVGTGQNLTSDYVPRASLFGVIYTGQAGLIPADTIISGKSTWNFDIRNDQGTALTSIIIVMAGIRSNTRPA